MPTAPLLSPRDQPRVGAFGRVVRTAALLAGASVIALVAAVATIAVDVEAWLSAPADPPARADVIFSLGGDPGQRAAHALDLYKAGFAPRILFMTQDGSGNEDPSPFPDLRGKGLVAAGVPPQAIRYEIAPQTTREESIAARAWMQQCGWRTALVVSDAVHTRRVAWTWRETFAATNLTFRTTPAPSRSSPATANLHSELKKNVFYRVRYAADACARDASCTGDLKLNITCRP